MLAFLGKGSKRWRSAVNDDVVFAAGSRDVAFVGQQPRVKLMGGVFGS